MGIDLRRSISDLVGGSATKLARGLANGVIKVLGDDSTEEARMIVSQIQREVGKYSENLVQIMSAELQAEKAEMEAKAKVMTAELSQGDNYTKRARPTVIYVALGVIVWDYVVLPTFHLLFGDSSAEYKPIVLPDEFWWTFSAIVSVYSFGRSTEKRQAYKEARDAFDRLEERKSVLGELKGAFGQ